MSRIGNKPVEIKEGVDVKIEGNSLTVKGPKGELRMDFASPISLEVKDNEIIVSRPNDEKKVKMLHGLVRSKLDSMIAGVTEGFVKELEVKGIGYRCEMKGNVLSMKLGYSHPIEIDAPEGITISVEDNTKIKVEGIDKHLVGQVAARIRDSRKVEPYKGKGIRYKGEQVRRKAGKAAKASAE